MTEIKCSAQNCGYNKNKFCNKQSIKFEGLFAKSKLGTFCQSFQNPHDSVAFQNEMADEMFENIKPQDENKSYIGCSANYCVHNTDNYCTAKNIKVGTNFAKYRSETQCDTFEVRK